MPHESFSATMQTFEKDCADDPTALGMDGRRLADFEECSAAGVQEKKGQNQT